MNGSEVSGLMNFLVSIGLLTATAMAGGCSFAPCEDDYLERSQNTQGQVLEIFQRDCGATTALAVHVAVKGISIEGSAENAESVFIGEAPCKVDASWESDKRIVIRGSCSRIFKQSTALGEIEIGYEMVSK